jgi:hypothetical protein
MKQISINFLADDEKIKLAGYPDEGRFWIEYGIGVSPCLASGFTSFFDAYSTLKMHRPTAKAQASKDW